MTIEQDIWKQLSNKIASPYGVAGVMGNLYAESKFDPKCVYPKVPNYIERLENGDMTKEEFMNDGVAFGLAQWRYPSRKGELWDWAQRDTRERPIAFLNIQIEFLLWEIKKYKTVWDVIYTTNSCVEASDIVMLRYEKPGNITETAKIKRSNYAQQFYNNNAQVAKIISNEKYVVTTAPHVNIRTGNGMNYGVLLQIGIQGTLLKYVAEADNGWTAVVTPSGRNVGWIKNAYLKEERDDNSSGS